MAAAQQSSNNDQTIDAARAIGLMAHPPSPGQGQVTLIADRAKRFSSGDLLSNRFQIIRFLGSGGMGEVYEARDRLLQDALVALKTISPEMASSPEAQDRFEHEVLLARQVTHPNVCPIYDIYYHADKQGISCFLCMKLLHGETLAARLDRQKVLSPDEAMPVVRQLAAALLAAHREGIIHRDVKPSNIMLEGSGATVRAVVTDFGLARRHDAKTADGAVDQIVGTPGYIAPELFNGATATAASDLYGFGVVLLEIFTGIKPSDASQQTPLKRAALRSAALPKSIAPLVVECLGDDPKKRSLAFQQALHDLHLKPPSADDVEQPKRKWTRRHLLGVGATAACAAVGASVWEWDLIAAAFSPLPKKRFVEVINFPPTSDRLLGPMLSGVIDTLERELSRAEAFDHNLLIMAGPELTKGDAEANKIRRSMGANLVLATSAVSETQSIQLSLKILDAAAKVILRQKTITCSLDELTLLPQKAVHAAAQLLGVSRYLPTNSVPAAGTESAEAYQSFQTAEALRRKPNDAGLDASIEKYKEAVEHDSRYALAHANLGLAYIRQYSLHHEPAALDLAQANAETSLSLNGNQVEAHLARGWVLEHRGQKEAALAEMDKALALDPGNPRTLIWEARVYSRLNQFPRAEQMYRRVLQARPNYWLAYNELGEILNRQGKYTEALRAYRSASLAQPENTLALNNVGQICLVLGQLNEAEANLRKSLALKPTGLAAANLAQALRSAGKNPEALTFALEAVDLTPSDDENWLELGDCYSALGGHAQDAQTAYKRAALEVGNQLQIDASDGPKWMLAAVYEAKLGRLASARGMIQKAESLGAIELDSQVFKIRILELTKQREAALAAVEACARRGATKFEISSMQDLQSLRADSRYLALFNPNHAAN